MSLSYTICTSHFPHKLHPHLRSKSSPTSTLQFLPNVSKNKDSFLHPSLSYLISTLQLSEILSQPIIHRHLYHTHIPLTSNISQPFPTSTHIAKPRNLPNQRFQPLLNPTHFPKFPNHVFLDLRKISGPPHSKLIFTISHWTSPHLDQCLWKTSDKLILRH